MEDNNEVNPDEMMDMMEEPPMMEEKESLLPSNKTSTDSMFIGITYNKAIARTVYLNP